MPWDEIERIRKEFERDRWVFYALGIISGFGLLASLMLYARGW